jgi:hypothetical protein
LIDGEILTSRQISELKTLFKVSVELVLFFFSEIGGHVANGFSSESGIRFGQVLGSGRGRSEGSEGSSWCERESGSVLERFPGCGAVYYVVSLFPAVEALSFCDESGTFFWGKLPECGTLGVDLSSVSLEGLSVFSLLFLEIS